MLKNLALSAVLILGTVGTSAAQEFGDWSVHSSDTACWAFTFPQLSEGSLLGRKLPQLSIQNDPEEGVTGSIAITTGGVDANQMVAEINVDGKKFETLIYNDAAFVGSGKPEAELTAAMIRGSHLSISWMDKGEVVATDTYSLKGFTAAKAEADRTCR